MKAGTVNILEEYYFDEYYRVLVMGEENKYVVSVDVYYASWKYSEYRELCVGEVCLLVKDILPSEVKVSISGVEKISVIGVKVKDKCETINVKWIMNRKPTNEEISSIYKDSWSIVKALN